MYKWLNTVLCIFAVTPRAGVRIEIVLYRLEEQGYLSPPARGCELKYLPRPRLLRRKVTPRAGVRIEI